MSESADIDITHAQNTVQLARELAAARGETIERVLEEFGYVGKLQELVERGYGPGVTLTVK